MTNKNSARGGVPIGIMTAATFNAQSNRYLVAAADLNKLYKYDFVKLVGTSNSNGIPYVTKAAAGEKIIGVIDGIRNIYTKEEHIYRAVGYELEISVLDDPFLQVEIQVNGTITTSDIGKCADLLVADGNDYMGTSGTQLDLNTLTTNSAQLKILGISETVNNEWGLYTKLRCIIAEHELKDIPVYEENIWDRTGTTITTHTAGDNVQLGGDLSVGGKLTVTGLIDPTGIILDGQAAAPSTDNGAFYYDNAEGFKFRNLGVWYTLAEEDIWDRTVGGLITSKVATDNLQLGGDVDVAGDVDIVGKLTVGGLIDPTGMSLDAQAVAPASVDGTTYYDTVNGWMFKNLGAWIKLSDVVSTGIFPEDLSSQITFDGKTSFTITYTPNDVIATLLFVNGNKANYGAANDYTISGTTLTWNNHMDVTLKTTDDFWIYYNYDISSVPLAQTHIYYVAGAGDDSFHGKNYQFPVKTLAQAITLVNAQVPSSSNRFEIQIIGAMDITENILIPTYTKIVGSQAKLTGTVAFTAESALCIKEVVVPNASSGLTVDGVTGYVELDKISGGTTSVGIHALNSGTMRAKVREIALPGVGSKAYNVATGGVIYLTGEKLREGTASTDDGSGAPFVWYQDHAGGAATYFYNKAGDTIIDVAGKNIIIRDSVLGTDIYANVGQYHKFTSVGSFEAYENAGVANVTGDGTIYTVIFNNEIRDLQSNYTHTTGIFKTAVAGEYLFTYTVKLTGFAAHNSLQIYLVAGANTFYDFDGDPSSIKNSANQIAMNGSHKMYLSGAENVYVVVAVSGGAKVISLAGSNFSKFSGILLTAY